MNSVLQAGADVNRTNQQTGQTALMEAASNACTKIAILLIEAGADVNKICARNETALLQFALKSNVQGVRLLLRSGAKLNIGRQLIGTQQAYIRLLLDAGGLTVMPRLLKSSTYTLHHHCRLVIRRHLLKLDQHENLFVRIPRLGLPSRVTKYLLFDTSLDENDT